MLYMYFLKYNYIVYATIIKPIHYLEKKCKIIYIYI